MGAENDAEEELQLLRRALAQIDCDCKANAGVNRVGLAAFAVRSLSFLYSRRTPRTLLPCSRIDAMVDETLEADTDAASGAGHRADFCKVVIGTNPRLLLCSCALVAGIAALLPCLASSYSRYAFAV